MGSKDGRSEGKGKRETQREILTMKITSMSEECGSIESLRRKGVWIYR